VIEARDKPERKARGDGAPLTAAVGRLFSQMSPALLRTALARLAKWVRGLAPLDAVKDAAALLSVAAAAAPAEALAALVPHSAAAAAAPGAPEGAVEWHLRLLAGAVRAAGPALPAHLPALRTAIAAGFAAKGKAPRKAAGKLLRWALRATLDMYPAEARSHGPADWAAPGELWKKWAQPHSWAAQGGGGGGGALPPLALSWVTPTTEGRAAALALANEFLVPAMLRLRGAAERIAAGSPPAAGSSDEARARAPPAPGAPHPPPPPPPDADALRCDLTLLIAGVRGAVYALPDGVAGDDDVIAVGTAPQALLFSAEAGAAVYSGGGVGGGGAPLRQVMAAYVHALMRALAGSEAHAKDVDTQVLCLKALFRLASARGARMSKTKAAIAAAKGNKAFYRDAAWAAAVRAFSKVALAAEWAREGAPPPPSSVPHAAGGTHQLPRAAQVARVAHALARRAAESIFAVPAALHFPRERGLAGGGGGGGEDDDEGGGEGEGEGEGGAGAAAPSDDDVAYEDARGSSDDGWGGADWETAAPPQSSASAGGGGGGGSSAGASSAGVSLGGEAASAPAVYAFGRAAVAKLAPPELPYALLLSAVLRLTTSDYDELRRKALSYLPTLFNILPWLRRPAAVSTLARLERLTERAGGVDAAARAPALRAAGAAFLSAAGAAAGGGGAGSLRLAPYAETPAELAAAAAPLRHALVFGLTASLFALGTPTTDLFLLDKFMRFLLRVPALLGALPAEKHGEATAIFGGGAAGLMGRWSALLPPPAPGKAEKWVAARDALVAHVLAVAAPGALAGGGAGAPPEGAPPPPLRLTATGAYARSAAPLPPSPLHWRYELAAGGFLGVLAPPPPLAPLALAGSAAPAAAPAAAPPLPPHLTAALWSWALSNALSDSSLLRAQAFATLGALLHARAAAPRAERAPLPATAATLAAPAYASQFVAAAAKNHRRPGEPSPFNAGAGFRELAITHEGVRGGSSARENGAHTQTEAPRGKISPFPPPPPPLRCGHTSGTPASARALGCPPSAA
jgi:hypothetical protein